MAKRFTDSQAWAITAVVVAVPVLFLIPSILRLFSNIQVAGKEDAEAKKHPIEVSADRLIDAYSGNELEADERFKARWLRVSGSVSEISSVMGKPYLLVDGVQCTFNQSYRQALARLHIGDGVAILGKCSGKILGVVMLNDCER